MTSKLERLMNLTAALLATRRPLTAEEIRGRVEGYPDNDASFRRAFERDKDDLRQMGIPITVAEVPHSDPPIQGYFVDRARYEGQDPKLEPDELAALHVAASLVRIGERTDGALWKIGGIVDGASEVAASGTSTAEPLVALPTDPNLAPLFQAATELRVAEFVYNGLARTVEPQRLSFTRGHWYLAAYDRVRQDDRLYRVDRIESTVEVGRAGAFARHSTTGNDPQVRWWELGDGEAERALVLVDADQALFATHQLGPDAVVEQRADGCVVFALQVRNADAFRSFVLSFLDHAEVLEPAGLRAHVVDWLTALAGDAA